VWTIPFDAEHPSAAKFVRGIKKMALWRREFLSLGLTLAALGGGAASAAPGGPERVRPTDEPQDAWLEQGGQRHRIIFDTISVKGVGEALNFADNFYKANLSGYGIAGPDLSVVIILRHFSVVFGFNDAAWAKFGQALSDWGQLAESGIKAPAAINPYSATPLEQKLFSNGRRLSGVTQEGARFAVCEVAAKAVAFMHSKATGADNNAVLEELKANMIPGAVWVPAGIVTLNRAQERGYTACSCG
jgi:intracellular sulfur oxidation DsrE/DsrF family protein